MRAPLISKSYQDLYIFLLVYLKCSIFSAINDAGSWWHQNSELTIIPRNVIPLLNAFEKKFTTTFGKQWAEQVLRNATTNPTLATNIVAAPQAINPAVGFTSFNLRPFTPAAATPSVTIGLIYLIV